MWEKRPDGLVQVTTFLRVNAKSYSITVEFWAKDTYAAGLMRVAKQRFVVRDGRASEGAMHVVDIQQLTKKQWPDIEVKHKGTYYGKNTGR